MKRAATASVAYASALIMHTSQEQLCAYSAFIHIPGMAIYRDGVMFTLDFMLGL